ncbi:efflux RND transporter permease subunit [Actinoplanes friuliensis]|uniref:Putative cation/multidrug efflux protein n=1 Tax=Actinoplanes friuliensis DSM 7358 TaxID=1246995 RepID=U5W970_9ACTN|nr:efflux RND transporter permease subunit [Actinoplanes friuliensis]AGZ45748.1 putative cation/multidrug efflux protein [Actinoplanes friuliensis DSM 7358]
MSFLTRLSLANRGLVALIAVVITGFGIYTVPSLKQQLLPSLEFPGAFIGVVLPGASPEIMEEQVTKPIEDAVKGADGLDTITSTTREGSATIQVLFEFGTDLDNAVNQLTTSVNRIQPTLPDDVEPTIFAGSTDDIPAIILAASDGKNDQAALANRLQQTVVPELNAIEGVREVAVTGTRDQQVVIVPDRAKLGAAGVDPRSIATLLQNNGISIPAGAVTDGSRSLSVQVGTPIATVDQLKGLYLNGSKGPVRLDSVASVTQQLAAATSFTRTDGVESLGIAVTASPDGNPVNISHEVRDKLAELESASGSTLTVITDQAPFVERSIESLTTEGLLGLIMAVIVILVFLLSVRSTLVTAVSIPLSVVIALIALKLGDYSLNLLTLGALTIAVGRVVDDSIVVLENIKRHLGYGEAKTHAITAGVKEVAGAVTASTLTTVAVFAPIALVGGFVGQLFAPFAITVTVALIASLFVSLTVVPVLAYWFLSPAAGGSESEEVRKAAEEKELRSPLQRAYLPIIRWVTRSKGTRWSTVAIGVVVLIGTLGLASRLETNFLDESGQDTITVSQDLPVGTDLAATNEAAKKVEAILATRGDVKNYQVTVGNGDFNPFVGSGGASGASFNVALKDDVDAAEVSDELREQFKGMTDVGEVTIGSDSGTGFDGSALAVVVQAADQTALESATKQVQDAMAGTKDVTDVSSSLAASVPRLDVKVDRAAAAARGLTESAIGQSVAGAFRAAPAGQISIDGVSQSVVVTLGAPPKDAAALRNLPLTAPNGQVVTLDSVADVSEVDGPEEVTRIDGNRSVTVNGTATGSNLSKTTADLTARLDDLQLPPGASYEIGGVSQDQADAFADLGLAVLAAIAIVFVIMVATFRSLLQPLLLLVSIPFAATGAIALLLATGTPLGVPALIGVLMLVGIVVTNAIVLMDLINHYRQAGLGVQEAVIEGGRHRLRPILMTAIATIFALLPMALGLTGEGGFISQPLAIVVIGGLVSSTLLTLVLVPTLYTMAENTKLKARTRRERKRALKAVESSGAGGDAPKHAADEPEVVVPADDPTPASSGGAHEAPEGEPAGSPARSSADPQSGALRGYTDQFEVLKMPRRPANPPTA